MVLDLELSQGNGDGEGGVLMSEDVGVGDFFEEDKENICVSLEEVVEPLLLHQRSPLPMGYLRSPLQDITAILSSVNTKEDEGGCRRHKRPHQCRSQQNLLMQLCSPFEEVAATSLQISPFGQCTVLGCTGRAGPSGSMDPVTQDLAQHQNTSDEITEQSRELWRLAEEKESEKQVKFKHLAAESLYQVKEHLVMMASKLSNGAGPASSRSQKAKRRKPFVKHILGQSVPRFQYPSRTALCNFSQPQVVWLVNSSEQDVCA
ncbi:unnamed protein product [Sphagnum troendelagicum]|uniref:Uncharacterized protein n=1 Tax=Sphagnum troendelagicum TaxID=128251 RepID=A0ABP0UDW2_9BRYO